MNEDALRRLLADVGAGKMSIDEAVGKLQVLPFEALGFATVDHHRSIRCGFSEVIYCPGKTPGQVTQIFARLLETAGKVLATRADSRTYQAVAGEFPKAVFHEQARAITLHRTERPEPLGQIAIVSAGTSDSPVAEEAAVTAEFLDQRVSRHYDVGVAGLHRLLACLDDLRSANAVVVVAGMEGALASVVGGLLAAPVIAVPTSVGYGASFGGVAALLAMLNSCASNVSVVNIDNGFAGGYIASVINRRSASSGK